MPTLLKKRDRILAALDSGVIVAETSFALSALQLLLLLLLLLLVVVLFFLFVHDGINGFLLNTMLVCDARRWGCCATCALSCLVSCCCSSC